MDKLELSTIYLDDAINGRNISFVPQKHEWRLYQLYKKPVLRVALYLVYVVYLSLAIFEFPAHDLIKLPFWVTVIVEFFCISFFLYRFIHEVLFTETKTFWTDIKHVTLCVIILLIVLDIVIYTALAEAGYGEIIRWSRPLRPFVIVNFTDCRQVRQGFRNIRQTLPEVMNVLFLFFANTALFALMAYKLFGSKAEDTGYFSNYFESMWDLYVLVTTANHPDIMMPAIRKQKWAALFFICYLIINLYMFMSVFLAVVYNRFRCNLKNEVKESLARNRNLMAKAFDCISEDGVNLSKEKYKKALLMTSSSFTRDYVEAILMIIDPNDTGFISRESFLETLEVLKLNYFDLRPKPNLFQRCMPRVYETDVSRFVIKVVRHKRFRNVFDFVIVMNAFCIGLNLHGVENYFLVAFLLEILLKIYAFGFTLFFKKMWNIFDFLVVGTAILLTTLNLMGVDFKSTAALDTLLILRVTRIFKVFHAFPRFRIVLDTLVNILPSLATYGSILFIIFYCFAIIGMELFHGRIMDEGEYCGNIKLKDSEFYRHEYCPNNFNHMLSSFIVLFELMVVNQWHVITEGYVLVSSKWARIYFITFHLVCVILILNILTAFVLEAFVLEYSQSTAGIRSRLAQKVIDLGLAQGMKNPPRSPASNANNHQQSLILEEELDADHEEADEDWPFEKNRNSGQFKNVSMNTTIRFKLCSKAKSVQHLLERIFEKDLE